MRGRCRLFHFSEKYSNLFFAKRHLIILDIGSGIGGNMVGMLKYISSAFPGVQSVKIDSVDGNERVLNFQAFIIENIELYFTVSSTWMNRKVLLLRSSKQDVMVVIFATMAGCVTLLNYPDTLMTP